MKEGFNIKIMQNNVKKYKHVQPIDIFALLLENDGIKDVDSFYHKIIPKSMRGSDERVVRDWIDYYGYLGVPGTAYTPYKLWLFFTRFSRGVLTLNITEEDIWKKINKAKEHGCPFIGETIPYKGLI